MKLTTMGIAALVATAPFAVSAATLQADEISREQATLHSGAFTEKYLFQLDSNDFPTASADVAFSFSELKSGSKIDIDFGPGEINSFVFSRDLAGTDVIWGGNPEKTSLAQADVLNIDGLHVDVPTFYLTIIGTAVGTSLTNSGSFSFDITATPAIPEPQSYSMALAGLAALGLVIKKRSGTR